MRNKKNSYIEAHKRFLKNGKKFNNEILDIGCGKGDKTFSLTLEGNKVDFVDSDVKKLNFIPKNKNVKTYHVDAIKFLKNNKKKYDIIFCIDVIEHINKDSQLLFLDLLIKNLRKNGILILQTINSSSPYANIYFYGDITHTRIMPYQLLNNYLKNKYSNAHVSISNTPCLTYKSLIVRWLISFPILVIVNFIPKIGLGIRDKIRIFTVNYLCIFQKNF